MYRVLITGPAERDIRTNHDWWARNRSSEQAAQWYIGIHEAIISLKESPERCSIAAELDLQELGLRQLLFGSGRRATHRIIFGIDGNQVIVLRVRHTSQDALSVEDLD